MTTCPECGSLIEDPSIGFCANCGRKLDGSEQDVRSEPVTPTERKKKYTTAVLGIILVLSAIGGLFFVGGVVDFEYDYDDNGDMVFTNTSAGFLGGYKWEFTGDNGTLTDSVTVAGVKATLHGTQPSVFTVTLYGYTNIGVEKKVSKEITELGVRSHVVEWVYGGNEYVVEYSVSVTDYKMYKDIDIDRWPGRTVTPSLVERYMTADTSNNVVENIVGQLKDRSVNMTYEGKVNFIMSFVQQLSYIYDSVTGSDEYWRFVVETLFVGGGDCEDVSILCMTLFKGVLGENNADTALLLYWPSMYVTEGHAMAAIALSYTPALNDPAMTVMTKYNVGGKTYYACECTHWSYGREPKFTVGVTLSGSGFTNVYPDHILRV